MVSSAMGTPQPKTPRRQMNVDRPIARYRSQRANAVERSSAAAGAASGSRERESRATIGSLSRDTGDDRMRRNRCLFVGCRGSRAIATLPQEQLRDGLELHVRRTLVDRPDLRVAIEFLDRIVLRVAVAAKELDAERGHALTDLRGVQLRHRTLARDVAARVLDARRVIDHEARGFE